MGKFGSKFGKWLVAFLFCSSLLGLDSTESHATGEEGLLFDGTDLANYSAIQMEGGYVPPTARGSQIAIDGDMLRFDLHDEDTDNTDRVRLQAVSPSFINDGDEIWIVNEFMLPTDFPSINPPNWLTVTSMYGPPYNGTGPLGILIQNMGSGNVLAWGGNAYMNQGDAGKIMWKSPVLQPNKRYTMARRIKVSHDPEVGFLEIWFAERGTALQQQSLMQNGVENAVTRRYFATLDATNGGYANDSRINFYHNPNAPGFAGKITSFYHAEHKIWDATKVGIADIDPAKRIDPIPPTTPANLIAVSKTDTTAELKWGASVDNVGVSGYDIYVNGNYFGSTTETGMTITGLTAGTTYSITVKAKDLAGNSSTESLPLVLKTSNSKPGKTDTEPPTKPEKLKFPAKTDTTFDLIWQASKDNVGVTEYEIYVDGVYYGSTTKLGKTITGLSPGTTYTVFVKAKDSAGNVSKASKVEKVTTSPMSKPFGTIEQLSGNSWNNVNGWLGMKITIGDSPVIVEQLGRWVVSGSSGSHTVKIVEASTGADVAGTSVAIDTSDAAAGEFKYVELATHVTLSANTAYYLVSQEVGGSDRWYGYGTVISPSSAFRIDSAAKLLDGGAWIFEGQQNNTYGPLGFKYKG